MDLERSYEEFLPLIERIIASVARRHHLSGDDLAEFASTVHLKLIDSDYAVLRQHDGRAALSTYLFVVIQRCYFDYRDRQWGRWRPSAEATRLGDDAVALEMLIYREGWPLAEAIPKMLERNPGLTSAEVEQIFSKLPLRERRARDVGDDPLGRIAGRFEADERITAGELELTAARVRHIVDESLETADSEEKAILRLRFIEGVRPAAIAVMLGMETGRVYKRLELLLRRLRRALLAEGIDAASADALIENRSIPLDLALPEGGIHLSEPTHTMTRRRSEAATERQK